jgi:hypothetical protein
MPAAMRAKVLFHPLRGRVMYSDTNRSIKNRIRYAVLLLPVSLMINPQIFDEAAKAILICVLESSVSAFQVALKGVGDRAVMRDRPGGHAPEGAVLDKTLDRPIHFHGRPSVLIFDEYPTAYSEVRYLTAGIEKNSK